MHKYVIMGVQGSGKGTQAKMLAHDFDIVHISVGDIFRWHIQTRTKLGAKIKRLVDSGQLVPDEIVEEVVRRRLEEHDWTVGFILDGFPRNEAQAQFMLDQYSIDTVIHINIADQLVIKRMLARRLCSGCGRDYNLEYGPPTEDEICDDCGGKLVTRADDNEAAIGERIADYHKMTEPVVELFRGHTKVVDVEGAQPPEKVQAEIRRKLGLEKSATR
ncbi:MAG: nucleoside monophosphate kinase [Planctomycetaceae bacterium]